MVLHFARLRARKQTVLASAKNKISNSMGL